MKGIPRDRCKSFKPMNLRMHEPIPVVGKWLRRVVQGYFNYHAVPGNSWRVSTFRKEVARA